MTPFRSEKNTNWEGAFRVPAMVRWPGHIQAGHGLQRDRLAGSTGSRRCSPRPANRTSRSSCSRAGTTGGQTYKVHLDGYNQLPYLTGQQDKSARKEFFYFNDDGELVAMRYENWKLVFCEQRAEGTLQVWARAVHLPARAARCINLRMDPYERADITSNTYYDWIDPPRVPGRAGAGAGGAVHRRRSRSSRRARRPSSFSVDQVMDMIGQPRGRPSGRGHQGDCQSRATRVAERLRSRDEVVMARRSRDASCSRASWRRRSAALSPGLPSRSPTRCRPGTTAREAVDHRLRRARDDARARPTSCRRPSASRPSTTTARCGPSSRSTSSSRSRSTASRRWRRSIRNGRRRQPFKAVLDGRHEGARRRGEKGLLEVIAATHAGMTTRASSTGSSSTGSPPRGIRASTGPTPSCVYQPMLELLAYLRANGFKTFIVSGGGIEFMRPWTEKVYGIPPEQVVGSSGVSEVRDAAGRQAGAGEAAQGRLRRRRPGQAGRHQPLHRPAADLRLRQFGRRPADAPVDGRRRAARASWGSCTTPTPSANGPTTASRTSASSTRRSTRRRARLDGRRHEAGLAARLPSGERDWRQGLAIARAAGRAASRQV